MRNCRRRRRAGTPRSRQAAVAARAGQRTGRETLPAAVFRCFSPRAMAIARRSRLSRHSRRRARAAATAACRRQRRRSRSQSPRAPWGVGLGIRKTAARVLRGWGRWRPSFSVPVEFLDGRRNGAGMLVFARCSTLVLARGLRPLLVGTLSTYWSAAEKSSGTRSLQRPATGAPDQECERDGGCRDASAERRHEERSSCSPRSTHATVMRMILMSSHGDQFSM